LFRHSVLPINRFEKRHDEIDNLTYAFRTIWRRRAQVWL